MATKLPLRQRKAVRTRAAIIEAATKLFEERGFTETTLIEIADLAEVHKQTVLRYFNNKEEIALALRTQVLEQFRAELEHEIDHAGVIACWRRHVSKSARGIAAHPDQFRFNQILMQNDRIVAQLLLIERRYEQSLAEALARVAGTGTGDDLYSKLLAATLVAGNFSVGNQVFKRGNYKELERACLAVVDFVETRFPARDS